MVSELWLKWLANDYFKRTVCLQVIQAQLRSFILILLVGLFSQLRVFSFQHSYLLSSFFVLILTLQLQLKLFGLLYFFSSHLILFFVFLCNVIFTSTFFFLYCFTLFCFSSVILFLFFSFSLFLYFWFFIAFLLSLLSLLFFLIILSAIAFLFSVFLFFLLRWFLSR